MARRKKGRRSPAKAFRVMTPYIFPAVAALLLAVAAGGYAVARVVEQARPDLSLTLMPSLAPALTQKADMLIAASNGGRDKAKLLEARRLAERALRTSPLDAPALRILALTTPGNEDQSARLVATALRVSRRDVGSQLLQIEIDVARNDIAATLRHYNQALTVKPSSGSVLYPVLLRAIDEPAVLQEARKLVSTAPRWLVGLVSWGMENPDYLKSLSRLVGSFPYSSEAMAPGYGQAMVEALVSRGELAEAFSVYRAYARDNGQAPRFSGGFTYRPIDWTVADNYEAGADLVEKPVLHIRFFADAGAQGVFLSRLAALRPSRYRILLNTDMSPGQDGHLSLIVSCQAGEEDRGVSQVRLPLRAGSFQHDFAVPESSCPYQWVRLSAAAGEESIEGRLNRIIIKRLGDSDSG